jgi:EAL domain-containing protein (putative c-di-GMP-specific phosphodiesterase class I)/GGDEF domain-containing protein
MKEPLPPGSPPEDYRTGYLALKSVLYDRVTGLPAVPVLLEELRTLLDARRGIGVVHVEVVDLDMVESLYGWQVFDRIVARVAERLRSATGSELPAASLLAISGVAGDRFVAFVPPAEGARPDGGQLARIARALGRRLEDAFAGEAFAGLNPTLCFRVGHALLVGDPFFRFERCVWGAIERARASHDKRERRRELSWGEELHRIIQIADIDTVFQPVVDLRERRVLGYEAFARGPRDTLFEAPRAMFALSDRVGVSTKLDRMCCEAALRAFGKLASGVQLFLNVLPSSLADESWCHERLLPLVGSLALAPADLVLEVSEREAEPDPARFLASVAQFQADGFALALDDVGTGRAALETIERMRPDYLKLDVSLVRNIHESLIQQEVLETLTALAARIDAAVIAEGIETEAERAALVAGGARYGQGYLFAMPQGAPWGTKAAVGGKPASASRRRAAARRRPSRERPES